MSNKFKLGGITLWRNNYGSILQAYALQNMISNCGDIDYEIVCQYGKKIVSWSNFIDKIKKIGLIKSIKRGFWKVALRKLRKRTYALQHFVDNYLRVSKLEYSGETISQANLNYDGFIFGSDQIWNPELGTVGDIYWGDFASDDKVLISYAPSVGVSHFEKKYAMNIKKSLSRFSAISSREDTGTNAINELMENNDCLTVLDPVFLVGKSFWDECSSKPLIKDDYLFVYMLRGTRKERKLIEKIAKEKNLKIVTMPFLDSDYICKYDFIFGDIKIWEANPFEFINLIRYSKYVITDSFHCSVFSIIYHVPFLNFQKIGKAQSSRMEWLLKMTGIASRTINENYDLLNHGINDNISWELVDEKIEKKKAESKLFLQGALNLCRIGKSIR